MRKYSFEPQINPMEARIPQVILLLLINLFNIVSKVKPDAKNGIDGRFTYVKLNIIHSSKIIKSYHIVLYSICLPQPCIEISV